MLSINVNEIDKDKVFLAAECCMGSNVDKFVAEVLYFDGYSELTKKQYDKNGSLINEGDITYDPPKSSESSRDLFFSLDVIKKTRKGLKKGDKNYWNHCMVVINRSGDNDIVFNFSEKLEEAREKGLLEALGDELYNKYKQEREHCPDTAVENSKTVSSQSESATEMSIDQLLRAIYQELVSDIPEKWINFQVESEIFQKDGQEVVSNYFRYQTESGEKQKEFTPENIFLPGNAMKKIQQKMKEEENDGWRKALFTFNVDKSVNIEVLEK